MRKPRVFIALLSVLILSGLLSLLTITVSTEGFLAHTSLLNEESYRASRNAAYTCAHLALHSTSVDTYRFEDNIPVRITLPQNTDCIIIQASTTAAGAQALVQGHSGSSYSTMYVDAVRVSSTSPFEISTWREY